MNMNFFKTKDEILLTITLGLLFLGAAIPIFLPSLEKKFQKIKFRNKIKRGIAMTAVEFYDEYGTFPCMLLKDHFVRCNRLIKQSMVELAVRTLMNDSKSLKADDIVALLPTLIQLNYVTFKKGKNKERKDQAPLLSYFQYLEPDARPD